MDIGGTKGLGFGCTLESCIHSFQRFTRLCKNDEQCEEHEEPQHGKGETRRQQSRRMEPNPGCWSFDRERLQKKTRNTLKRHEINNSLNSLF